MKFRVRIGLKTKGGEWSIGIGRSRWPRPQPNGMTLYVLHLLWWNLLLEVTRP